MTGYSDDLELEIPMLTQKSLQRLLQVGGLYKGLTVGILSGLESRGTPYTLKKHLQAIEVQVDHILRFSICFVSWNARLAQV